MVHHMAPKKIRKPREIHELIRKRRTELKLTQEQLGDHISELAGRVVGKTVVNKWERGPNAPRPSMMEHVAAALGYPAPRLWRAMKWG